MTVRKETFRPMVFWGRSDEDLMPELSSHDLSAASAHPTPAFPRIDRDETREYGTSCRSVAQGAKRTFEMFDSCLDPQ